MSTNVRELATLTLCVSFSSILNLSPAVQVWSSASHRSARWSSHYYQGTCKGKKRTSSDAEEIFVWMLQWSISGGISLAQKNMESPYSSFARSLTQQPPNGAIHILSPAKRVTGFWKILFKQVCQLGLAHPSCPGCPISYTFSLMVFLQYPIPSFN